MSKPTITTDAAGAVERRVLWRPGNEAPPQPDTPCCPYLCWVACPEHPHIGGTAFIGTWTKRGMWEFQEWPAAEIREGILAVMFWSELPNPYKPENISGEGA